MNLLHLRYFVELAHTQHFTRAAERLCITQPSLSHAITQLETELGVPLFERTGRTTTLTRFGEQFLLCAQQTMETLDEGVDALQRVARGEGLIRLGLLRTLGVDFVPGLAARYLREHPGRDIRFTFHTGVTQHLLDGLLEKRFDLVYSSMTPAMGAFSSLEKMISMSRGYCCNSCCILSRSTMEEELRKVLGEESVRPAWDGKWFYSLLNLVWLMGYFPYTDYYPIEYTDRRELTPDSVRESLRRLYRGTQLEEWQVEQGYEHLMALSDNGVFVERCSNWYGAVLWDTRIRTERW